MFTIQEIPLFKLVPSAANVRHGHKQDGIKQLAASIKAHGLLHNLTVRKGTGDIEGCFEVIAGERRLSALQRLADEQHIAASVMIPCNVIDDESAEELSLAENVTIAPMHPADQYAAFAKLHAEQNMPAEDIAARFGVSAAVVRQRLKLGSVSPTLIAKYRKGDMTLDQLTAFAITDDHKAQERAWRELPRFNNSREAILDALTEAHVPANDRRAVFVGMDTYRKAGGAILCDLFDKDSGGYLTDADLLNRLAREKLQRLGARVLKEGWKWVTVDLAFDHAAAAQMRRVHPVLSSDDQITLASLKAQEDALYEEDDGPDREKLEAISTEIADIEARERFAPEDVSRSGAFLCLGSDGKRRIERGFVRKEDERPNANEADGAKRPTPASQDEKPKGLSDKLVTELTACRTSALRNELAHHPETAHLALIHALVVRLFYQTDTATCLLVSARQAPLHMHAPDVMDAAAEQAIAARHAGWEKRFPEDTDELWPMLEALDAGDRANLLAHCVGLMVDAVHDARTVASAPASVLATSVRLDMKQYWRATAENYFSRVSKERIAEAVAEAISPEAAANLADMKKGAMAQAAAERLKATGWLPTVLRTG